MLSEVKEPVEKLLERSLVFKLQLIRQILEFFQADFVEKNDEIQDLLKQLANYNFCAQTVRRLQRKYMKSWFQTPFTKISCDLVRTIGGGSVSAAKFE